MGLDTTEPPTKRQRSTAAVILGAAVETVIFTSAVALSAYQLLTGKGKQQLDATMTSANESNTADGPLSEASAAEQSMVVSLLSKMKNRDSHLAFNLCTICND